MKGLIVVLMVVVLIVGAVSLTPTSIGAWNVCDLAAFFGWTRPALNNMCMAELTMEAEQIGWFND